MKDLQLIIMERVLFLFFLHIFAKVSVAMVSYGSLHKARVALHCLSLADSIPLAVPE